MRRLGHALALVALALAPFALVTARPPFWQGSYQNALCLDRCCLITNDFFELSCGEYDKPGP